jgi:hypothetical protein
LRITRVRMNQRLSSVNCSCQKLYSDLCITKWRNRYNHPNLKFYIGDVRDEHSVPLAMREVDYENKQK